MRSPVQFFWYWLLARTLVWFVAVVASHPNAPIDLVEWLSWGGVWQWGYCKHPPLPAWLADAAASLDPGRVWPVYWLSYSIVALTLVAVWKLAREYLPAPLALVATIANDGLMYSTNDGAEYSNNIVLNCGWIWLILAAHRAIFRQSTGWWYAVGAILGSMLLTKYTIGLAAFVLVAFLLVNRSTWSVWRSWGIYLAFGIAVIVVAPHVGWLIRNDFLPMKYAAERSTEAGGWERHLIFPVQFVAGQALIVAPVAFILLPLLTLKRQRKPLTPERRFLLFAIVGPVAVLLLLSISTGVFLREIWGSPLWCAVGVLLIVLFRRGDAELRMRPVLIRWVVVAILMLSFTVGKQVLGPRLTGKPERPHFPGRALADEVNARWAAQFGGAPPAIVGEAWRAGNVCVYSAHRPGLYSSGHMDYFVIRPEHSPWISDDELNRNGCVLIWDAETIGGDSFDVMNLRFPRHIPQPEIVLPLRAWGSPKSTRVGLAFVPPLR